VDLESVLAEADPYSARVSGRIRMEASPGAGKRLERFVDDFEGLYPEGDLHLERDGATLRASFRDVNVGPEQLLSTLRELADPLDSLEGDLEVGSFVEHALDRDFRLIFQDGVARAERPGLWPEG
jgi:hypothetical protein